VNPFPCPAVQLSEGIFVSKENTQIKTTTTLAGRRKSKIFFSEYRTHKIPAEIHPSEIKIKYNALTADISGYDDQSEVNRNQRPGIINTRYWIPDTGCRISDSGLCWDDVLLSTL
jgi:hypothetical protein